MLGHAPCPSGVAAHETFVPKRQPSRPKIAPAARPARTLAPQTRHASTTEPISHHRQRIARVFFNFPPFKKHSDSMFFSRVLEKNIEPKCKKTPETANIRIPTSPFELFEYVFEYSKNQSAGSAAEAADCKLDSAVKRKAHHL